jgi:tetratricopeptide (TPR) repeat protein
MWEFYTKIAQYDQAMTSYMHALDIRHKAADTHAAAQESDGIGIVFVYQGRLGAAISSLQEAANSFREANDRSENMAQILSDLAKALAEAGRSAEAAKTLAEAQGLAAELKNDKLMSEVLNTRGDVLFYGGDYKGGKSLYQQGLQAATRAKAQDGILVLRLNLAEVSIAEGHSQPAVGDLRAIIGQADGLNLKYLSLKGSADLAEALINTKYYSRARQELEHAMGVSEKLGVRLESARIHYLLGSALRLSGNSGDAAGQYRQAVQLLEDMKKESGAEHLLERSDLRAIHEEATRWSSPAKS